jgi:hypothetical protein
VACFRLRSCLVRDFVGGLLIGVHQLVALISSRIVPSALIDGASLN